MRKSLNKSLPKTRSSHETDGNEKKFETVFGNAQCPYCSSHKAYSYELKFDIARHCPDCNANWIEVGNGTIWKIPK